MNKDTISKFIMRPLSAAEEANFCAQMSIATERVNSLLCSDIRLTNEARQFYVPSNTKVLHVGFISEIVSVKINGTEVTDFRISQTNESINNWFNSITFDRELVRGEIAEVEADFGLSEVPASLSLLLARVFDAISEEATGDGFVSSKRVEDFNIAFANAGDSVMQRLKLENSSVIDKYNQCQIGVIRSGCISSVSTVR